MAPLVLEGNNLGERHRYYNRVLKETIISNRGETPDKISHDDNDIDNFLKIDIASHNRDVNYILEVLKCKDLLYVTRAIKKSKWLIKDDNYSHIINPKYLHKELFPHMMSKAKSKLVLHIRLHLRDEKRVKQFYKYYKQFDKKIATKWLEHCPLQFALDEVRNHGVDVSKSTLKRLCRRSFEFLKRFAVTCKKPYWYEISHLDEVKFLVKHNVEEFLNVTDSCSRSYLPCFKDKHLKIIMKKCPERILNNFYHYFHAVKHPNLIKYMNKKSITDFLMNCLKTVDFSGFCSKIDAFMFFLSKIAYADRIQVLKACYGIEWDGPDDFNLLFNAVDNKFTTPCNFRWHQCAPYDIAFQEITKLINENEIKSDVRLSMLNTLLYSAGSNFYNISHLLKYYHDVHINEPHKYKKSFVNELLSCVAYYKFDSGMWKLLDDIFCSMEVYMNSSLDVTKCAEAIIVDITIHDQNVPEIIERKFQFDTLKCYKNKLSVVEREKLFEYLYNSQVKKIKEATITNEKEFKEVFESLENTLKLLTDWNKNVTAYPILLNKLQEWIKIIKQFDWDIDLSSIYNLHKPWRKYLFDDSFILYPSQPVMLNALKHNQNMLNMFKKSVDCIRYDEKISLLPVLSKLKIYYADTLAKEWTNEYLSRLNEPGKQKVVIQSLSVLLSQKDFLDIAKKYVPQETKINWEKADKIECDCQRYFANNIHRVRPLPPTDAVLWFAKGDYLKFAVTSLNATLAKVSHVDREEYISKLISVPVSLQKHGIRMAIAKLTIEKLIPIFETIWESTKNSSIRTILFLTTHKILCIQTRKSRILKLWKMLKFFIENLSDRVDSRIKRKIYNVGKVPKIIQVDYFMTGFLCFKRLPDKLAEKYKNVIINKSGGIVETCDRKFIEDEILGSVDDFPSKSSFVVSFFARYLLSITDTEMELTIYESRIKPLFSSEYYSCENSKILINNLFTNLLDHVLRNKTVPVNLFKKLRDHFKNKLTFPEDYVALRMWEVTCDLVEILERHTPNNYETKDDILNTAVLTEFGKACLKHLQNDTKLLESPIPAFECFMKTIEEMFDFYEMHKLKIYKYMLEDQNTVENYILVLKMLPIGLLWGDDEEKEREEIIKILCSHPSKEFQILCHQYLLYSKTQDDRLKCGGLEAPYTMLQ
ncbi:hypothetical protein ABMA28_010247 [Loxostege sticticalis]|uniref:Uncharacterized protein n=1 Tax=Loxostege sticticalis TaxID=481309 RepID=A0ABD0SCB8_LOXSC